TATTAISRLSLHDALPILRPGVPGRRAGPRDGRGRAPGAAARRLRGVRGVCDGVCDEPVVAQAEPGFMSTRNAEVGTRNRGASRRATTPVLLFRVPRWHFR